MPHHLRRIVVDAEFETVLGEVSRAIREAGLQVNARIDVRDHFWRGLRQNFRRYVLLQAWSPDLALGALQEDADAGVAFHTTFAIYEVGKAETAVVMSEPAASIASPPERHRNAPALSAIADEERARVTRILERLQHGVQRQPLSSAAV